MNIVIASGGYREAVGLKPGDWILHDSEPKRVERLQYMPPTAEVFLVMEGWNEDGDDFVSVDRVSAHQAIAVLKLEVVA